MAYTDVQIAKLALNHVGDRYDLTSLSDSTTEAEQVNLVYANLRDQLLREHPWSFAKRFKTYTSSDQLVGTPPDNWTYWFAYPDDCLRALYIVNPLGRDKPPLKFQVGYDNSDVRVVLCNEAAPTLAYTKALTNPALFNDGFAQALAYRIAWAVQRPLAGDIIVSEGEVRAGVEEGMSNDSNEGVEEEQTRDPEWITARG